jgi:hypothetical protein
MDFSRRTLIFLSFSFILIYILKKTIDDKITLNYIIHNDKTKK